MEQRLLQHRQSIERSGINRPPQTKVKQWMLSAKEIHGVMIMMRHNMLCVMALADDPETIHGPDDDREQAERNRPMVRSHHRGATVIW